MNGIEYYFIGTVLKEERGPGWARSTPFKLFRCQECGGIVDQAGQRAHDDWHDAVRYMAAHIDEDAFRKVVLNNVKRALGMADDSTSHT